MSISLHTSGASGKKLLPSHGFTLVELLIVIGIIGILVALLMPAVQAAREGGRRGQCENNLHQLGTALQGYVSDHGGFPCGCRGDGKRRDENWGWGALVLPYLEYKDLYLQLGVDKQKLMDLFSDDGNKPLLQTKLPVFCCPSDPTPDLVPTDLRAFWGHGNTEEWPLAKANYVACQGLYSHGAGDSGAAGENNGVFFNNSTITPAQITDGLSHTFMLGERDRKCGAAFWAGTRNPEGSCHWGFYEDRGNVYMHLNAYRFPRTKTDAAGNRPSTFLAPEPNSSGSNAAFAAVGSDFCDSCSQGFSSAHAGGANFIYCDNSVHFINENIDYNLDGYRRGARDMDKVAKPWTQLGIYQRLGIRNDGQDLGTESSGAPLTQYDQWQQ